ncbi:MAG: hypothetical protein NXH75_10285 [Halobacteriovoraceae bacterium]|jgi:hypothetical protein|nr:hypothetical protein [Halobacteriovoraceae bacterium]
METNLNTTESSSPWIENLAIEEINMAESGIVDLHEHLNPIHYLEESSIEFMNELRDKIEHMIARFNQYRGHQSNSHIKIFKISNTVNDFMLFRNSLRLIFARKANDLINIAFITNGKDLLAPRMKELDPFGAEGVHEIRAHLGPFNKITWRYQGEIVDMEAMVKHYLTEFIKQSAQ